MQQSAENQMPVPQDNHLRRHDDHQFQQNVVVMRHGDRMDNEDPEWAKTAVHPWNPPLSETGKDRAFRTGKIFRENIGFPIHKVFVSPFLRCVQTAFGVVSGLCAVNDNPAEMTRENVVIDPSKIKVSIEYGLCELLNTEAIRLDVAPKDGNFCIDISKLEEMLPAGMVDRSVEPVYQELPGWEELKMDAQARYERTVHALADKYPHENLLLVTHAEGVAVTARAFLKDITLTDIAYCASLHSRRLISFSDDQTFSAGDFEVLTKSDESGVSYRPTSASTLDIGFDLAG